MVKISVPFHENQLAKALGAKWDNFNKTWYVPNNLDISLFSRWTGLNNDSAAVKNNDNTHLSLSRLLAKVTNAVHDAAAKPEWVISEINSLKVHRSGSYYLELVQHDDDHNVIARAQAVIWKSIAASISEKFNEETGSCLDAGIKVLLLVQPQFDCLYGFKVVIKDIDPAYTIGDMQVKMLEIKNKLVKLKIFDLNKKIIQADFFSHIAVISPDKGASLADFRKEADLLEKYNLCRFNYFVATFQGKAASKSLSQCLDIILNSEHGCTQTYDAVVIIRGGGSSVDLTWLNDYYLAERICLSKLPVLVGIGHREDHTLLNEVCNMHFDTPSKVSSYILGKTISIYENINVELLRIYHPTKSLIGSKINAVKNFNSSIYTRGTYHIDNSYSNLDIMNYMFHKKVEQTLLSKKLYLAQYRNKCTQISRQLLQFQLRYLDIMYADNILQNCYKEYYQIIRELEIIFSNIILQAVARINAMNNITGNIISLVRLRAPKYVLAKGYCIVRSSSGNILSSVGDVKGEKSIVLELKDGFISLDKA